MIIEYINIHEIDIDAKERRPDWERNLDDLIESINKLGVLTPIVVGKKPDGRYQLINGYKRLKACKNHKIPAVVSEFSQQQLDDYRQLRNF